MTKSEKEAKPFMNGYMILLELTATPPIEHIQVIRGSNMFFSLDLISEKNQLDQTKLKSRIK